MGVATRANAVYLVDVVGMRPDCLMVVANIVEQARHEAPSIQAVIEADCVFPILRGRDVSQRRPTPKCSLLYCLRIQ